RRRHTRSKRDWSSDVCSSDLLDGAEDHTLARQFAVGRTGQRWTVGTDGDAVACRGDRVPALAEGAGGAGEPVVPGAEHEAQDERSEERRVGKERRRRWPPCDE